jgi:ATP-dependent Clp protease protease subunit
MINPLVFEKTKDGEVLYDIFSRLVKDRILFLTEEIDTDTATVLCASLLFLNSKDENKPIDLYINSPGGYLHSGLYTIYDTMNYIKAPVRTTCIGEAYSAGAFLLASGEKGERRAFPNSHIMIHEVQNFSGGAGHQESTSELKKRAKMFDDSNTKLINLLAESTGQTVEKVKLLMKEETYFSAEEAKEFGLIDRIVGEKPSKRKSK